jgi:hypothetical protein
MRRFFLACASAWLLVSTNGCGNPPIAESVAQKAARAEILMPKDVRFADIYVRTCRGVPCEPRIERAADGRPRSLALLAAREAAIATQNPSPAPLAGYEVATIYPRWHEFNELRHQVEPAGWLLNDHLRKVFSN